MWALYAIVSMPAYYQSFYGARMVTDAERAVSHARSPPTVASTGMHEPRRRLASMKFGAPVCAITLQRGSEDDENED